VNIDVEEYLTQGFVLMSMKKFDEALNYLSKAEAIEPLNPEVYIQKGLTYQELDQFDLAKKQFEKALKLNNADGRIYFHLGGVAAVSGDFSEAIELFKKSLSNGYHDAFVYFNMGMAYENLNDFAAAIKSYRKAIEIDSMRPEPGLRLAKLLTLTERFSEAADAVTAVIRANPSVPQLYHTLFAVYMQAKDFTRAREVLDDSIERFGENTLFLFDRIALLIAENKSSEALSLLDSIDESSIEDISDKRRLHLQKAQLLAYGNDLPGVICEFKKAKDIFETDGRFDAECTLLLIDCYVKAEDYSQVLAYSRDILASTEDKNEKASARYFEPYALKMLGRMDEALPLYKSAIDEYRNEGLSHPGYLDPYIMRAMCHKDIGEYEKAIELTNYVLSLKPDFPAAKVLQKSIADEYGKSEVE
jgi:tetratricopeptide (TPR) repeat protein